MSGETAIEWATHTWNPTTGCDRVSAGCDHCYAMTMAKRLKGMSSAAYQLDGDLRTSGPGFLAHEWPAALDWPLHKTKPLRIFVNSMSDLFHDSISDEYIAAVWVRMSMAKQHTFQILTKRHARMRSLLSSERFQVLAGQAAFDLIQQEKRVVGWQWPLPNVWLGVSVESQQWAGIRIPALLDTPAAVRFLSCEPLLGPVSLLAYTHGWPTMAAPPDAARVGLDWVIAGGESGPGARPMHPDWVHTIRDECVEADVAFLFKQWGTWAPSARGDAVIVCPDGQIRESLGELHCTLSHYHAVMSQVGKKAAGRELNGRTWDEYPQAVSV